MSTERPYHFTHLLQVLNHRWQYFLKNSLFYPFPIISLWEKNPRSRANNKWIIRSDRNSNSSEILCLSSLTVSLMKTEFIVNEKRWRHHFPHSKSKGTLKGKLLRSEVRPGPNSNSSEILYLSSSSASSTKIQLKVTEKTRRHRFAHYMSMGAFFSMVTTVLIRSAPKPMQPFLHPKDATCTDKIWLNLANWSWRYNCSKVWTKDDDDGRRATEPCYTMSSHLVSLRLRWAKSRSLTSHNMIWLVLL